MSIYKLKSYRDKIKQIMGSLDDDVKRILNDRSMIKSDREDRAEYAKSQVRPKIEEQISLMGQEYHALKTRAQEKYNIYKKQDKSDMAARAAVLLPMLQGLTGEELLRLFKARAGERLDREIISELINVKSETTGDLTLMQKLVDLDNETVDLLPEKELEARRQLEDVKQLERYMEEAIAESTLLASKLEGRLKNPDGTRLTTSAYILDQLEQGKKFDTDKITPIDESKFKALTEEQYAQ